MTILLMRRPLLGVGSMQGVQATLNTLPEWRRGTSPVLWRRHDFPQGRRRYMLDDPCINLMLSSPISMVIRWGCTARIPSAVTSRTEGWSLPVPEGVRVINKSEAIRTVNDKLGFVTRMHRSDPTLQPTVLLDETQVTTDMFPLIVRPRNHAQGRHVYKVDDVPALRACLRLSCMANGWYARSYVAKVAEYRVYVVQGRVACVAQKHPQDPSAIAWNHARGATFTTVRWDDWPGEVCDVAVRAFDLSGLDISGVDVMVDGDGRAYVIECNSAPSLPPNEDGSPSYRHVCLAKTMDWMDADLDVPPAITDNGWRGYVHPSIWVPREQRVQ